MECGQFSGEFKVPLGKIRPTFGASQIWAEMGLLPHVSEFHRKTIIKWVMLEKYYFS